jgi:predicted DCC family thiol-disulfide oxidoreductase YuxK
LLARARADRRLQITSDADQFALAFAAKAKKGPEGRDRSAEQDQLKVRQHSLAMIEVVIAVAARWRARG